jgi:hypothetical protein
MANIVEFVSTKFIKEHTNIENNVDDSKIKPLIVKVQDTHLQQIIGSSFYEHLMDAVYNDTLTANELILLRNYIQRFVSEYVFFEVFPFLNYKSTNKGVSKESSEYSVPAELSEIKFMRSAIRDIAEFYGARLDKYLTDNSSLFPEYTNPTQPENLPKTGNIYQSGIYLKSSRNCDITDQYKNNN